MNKLIALIVIVAVLLIATSLPVVKKVISDVSNGTNNVAYAAKDTNVQAVMPSSSIANDIWDFIVSANNK